MASSVERGTRLAGWSFIVLVVITAVLYLAREVLIPLTLAILFSFLLAPAVRHLEHWRIGRGLATVIVTVLFVAVFAAVGWFTANQAISLVGKLPEYKDNIAAKVETLRAPPKGDLGKAAKAIKELEKQIKPKPEQGGKPGAPQAAEKPAPTPQTPWPTTAIELLGKLGVSLLALLAASVAVIVLTAMMLLQRDDLRDRLIRLVGEAHIHLTTQAMQDAGRRVSRYLMMQLVVNACYGVPLATALHLIGLPNALLWGVLATVLRFIPYLGAAIAASLPILLAFAISDGWTTIAWTVGVIATLEFLTAYVVEPWLYGESTGLSPLAVVFAAIFWTWLWGPIGLLLAMPLTVCLAATGRHIPQFRFFDVLLGVEPVLPPAVRFYQRLVAMEYEEALDVAEQYAREHGLVEMLDGVVLPALLLAKRDRQRDALDEKREQYVFESMQRIVEEIGEERKEGGEARIADEDEPICIVPAHDDADFIAAIALARAVAPEHYRAHLIPHQKLAGEALDEVAAHCEKAVCISAVPPSGAANATYLVKRLRHRFPQQKIVVALWHANSNLERIEQRLREAGANEVVTSLPRAMERIRLVVPPRTG